MKIVHLGRADYLPTLEAMRAFTRGRTPHTPDELWVVEHPPVFTLGQAGKREHILAAGGIPVVQSDRGGQVTYHGPGQVVVYALIDLKRLGIFVKEYVFRIERAVLQVLESHRILGEKVANAPGVYVRLSGTRGKQTAQSFDGLAKIAALGVKVAHGCAYHGVALNVAMDLEPFRRINPCGYAGLATVDLATLRVTTTCDAVAAHLCERLAAHLEPRTVTEAAE
jgi:lipoyl(octanoyl) transferase